MTKILVLTIGLLALAGCSSKPSAPPPLAAAPVVRAGTALNMSINAPATIVRETIASRARQRGTAAKFADARSVVLERTLADTPASLVEQCGPHKPGRIVRVILTTVTRGAGTDVSERRFIIDADGANCAVTLSEAEAADGTKSLADLKAQAESQGVRR